MSKFEVKVKVDEEKKVKFCGCEIIIKNNNCVNKKIVMVIE